MMVMMSIGSAVMMTGYVGPFRNYGSRDRQSGRMVILVPLTDSLDEDRNKCTGHKQEHYDKHNIEHSESSESTHSTEAHIVSHILSLIFAKRAPL